MQKNRILGEELTAAIANGATGSVEITNTLDEHREITNIGFVYPDSNYDDSLVTRIEEVGTGQVYLTGNIQYKMLGQRAGVGQFRDRMIHFPEPIPFPPKAKIRIELSARYAHSAQDLAFLLHTRVKVARR